MCQMRSHLVWRTLMILHGEHRYIPVDHAMDAVLLGWLPLPSLDGTHHGRWAVHMAWLCDCPARLPTPLTTAQPREITVRD